MQGVEADRSDEVRTGLVNYGLAVFEIDSCSSLKNYWDIRNHGEIKVVTKTHGKVYSFYVYGRWVNLNVTNVYATSIRFQYGRSPSATPQGVWNVYGYPVRYRYAPKPVGQRVAGMWKEYLADVYQNASDLRNTLWNPTVTVSFFVKSTLMSPNVYEFGRLNSYGSVEVRASSSPIRFNRGLSMGMHGRLCLQAHLSSTSLFPKSNNALVIGKNSELTTGAVLIYSGWNVSVERGSRASFYHYVTVYEQSALIAKTTMTVTFHDHLTSQITSLLYFSGSVVTCLSCLTTMGSLELGNGSLTIHGMWELLSGSVTGSARRHSGSLWWMEHN